MAKTLKGIFRNVPAKISKAGPETFGHWIGEKAKDAAKSTAGEVLITTPSQTLTESLLAEGMGVRDETTWGEKGLSTLDAISIAVGQSVGTNTGRIAIGGGVKTIKGDFDGRAPKPNTVDQVPPKGGKFDPEVEVKPGGSVDLGEETSGIRFSKAEDTPSQVGREWLELAKDERTQQLPTSTARDFPTVLKETMMQDASDVTIKESRAMNGSIDGYDFVDPNGKVIQVRDYVENEVYLDTSDAGKHRTGIYQSIYSWAHNNGRKVVEDPGGMSHVAQLRRASQMLSSALRFGTTKHMEPGIDGNIAGWREGDSVEATEHNVGLLALKEAELVKQRLPQLMTIRYDGDSQSFYDGEYRIPNQDLKSYIEARIRELDSEFAEGVGPATLRRALATIFATEYGSRSSNLALVGHAGAPQSLQKIRYALSPLDSTRNSQEVSYGGEKERPSPAAESGRSGQETRSGSPAPGGESSEVSGGAGSERSGSESAVANKNPDVSRVERLLDGLQSSWGSKLKTQVHASVREITDESLRKAALQSGNVEGFFNPEDQTIHIIADRVKDMADAERLLRHEGLHWAFAGPLKEQYAAVIEQIGREIPWERMQEVIAKYPEGNVTLWIEEYLAARGEKNPDFSLRRKFYAGVREILRKFFGEKIEFTDAELEEFLYKANRRLEQAKESDSRYFDQSEGADPLYAKKKAKGPQRASWDEVQKGDRWNSVKKHFPRGTVSHDLFPEHGDKDEVVQRAADFLTKNAVVTDWTGRTVYLPYGQTQGGYKDELLNRAEHVVCYDEEQGAHNRKLDSKKIKWLAAVPVTIREANVRVKTEKSFLYFKAYKEGVHMVVTSPEGVLLDQDAYNSGLVTQFPVHLKSQDLRGGVVDAIRR